MAYIKEYWTDKVKRAEQAIAHTRAMSERYGDITIVESVRNTKIYDVDFVYRGNKSQNVPTEIFLADVDTVTAGMSCHNHGKIALLNFASYKKPGGMFMNRSIAQEESLCHASFLYNVLSNFPEFYEWNNNHKNKALYLNRALYSPDIIFQSGTANYLADVITCAAPNKSVAQKYCNVSDAENYEALQSRVKFVLDVARDNQVETIVLGAYGCGVFGQNPVDVAAVFKEYFCQNPNCFKKVVFAIPKVKNGNYDEFAQVLWKVIE